MTGLEKGEKYRWYFFTQIFPRNSISNMINEIFFFFSFIHLRYNALLLCLLPVTSSNDRLSSISTSRDQAIECLKRAGIDNYKVSQTCRSFLFFTVLFDVEKRKK